MENYKSAISWNALVVQQNGPIFGTRGHLVTHMWSTFALAVFKVILTSFCASISKWPVTPKRLIVE